VHDDQGRIQDVNKVACEQLGYTHDELLSKTIFDIEVNDNKNNLIDIIWPSLLNGIGKTMNGTHIRKDGSHFSVEVNMTSIIDNSERCIFALARDVTETEKLKKHLSRLAMTDELTNIFNRRALMQSLDKELSRAKRKNENLSVLMIDIDHFKKINDKYGHQTGDETLKYFVDKTKKVIRTEDIFGRFGGEEFVVLLPGTELKVASSLAERLRKTVADSSFEHNDNKILFTVSIGVATFDDKNMDSNVLLKNADQVLCTAKGRGRNQVIIYSGLD
jgi:diguanylate cyclase (GGDEF)-like protein/PAS domain S-box-containing protein